MKKTRDQLVQLSSLYYRCEKYDDMINCAKELIADNPSLNEKEKNVLYEGYKYKISSLRRSIVRLFDIMRREKKKHPNRYKSIYEIIKPLISQLVSTAQDFENSVDIVLTHSKNFDEMVYFHRVKCDALRYKAMFSKGEELNNEIKKFEKVFNKGEEIAKTYLEESNENYLNLMLSKCVFIYEVENKKDDAINLAKEWYNKIKGFNFTKPYFKELLRLFRDNVIIWSGKCEDDVRI